MTTNESDPRAGLGRVHVLTGSGRGKTTSAFGLASRAWGNGLRVAFLQFMKQPGRTGEAGAAEALGERFEFISHGCGFVRGKPRPEDIEAAAAAMKLARTRVESGTVDLLVLDEVNVALKLELVARQDVEDILTAAAQKVELVLTGRGAPEWLADRADYWTELREVKHPLSAGVKARRGVEY